jgi:hypothetical protein
MSPARKAVAIRLPKVLGRLLVSEDHFVPRGMDRITDVPFPFFDRARPCRRGLHELRVSGRPSPSAPRHVHPLVDAVEALEDARQVLLRNADAVVDDSDRRFLVVAGCLDADAPFRSV